MIDVKEFRNEGNGPAKGFGRRSVLFVSLAILIILLYNAVGCFFEYTDLREIGAEYTSVFFTRLLTGLSVRAVSFATLFIAAFLNLLFIRLNLRRAGIERGIITTKTMSALLCVLAALLMCTALGETLAERYLMFANPEWFGRCDPIFGKDIGYYIFMRPFLMSLTESAVGAWFIIGCMTFVLYWVLGVVFGGRTLREVLELRGVGRHIAVNVGILLILNCFTFVFRAEDILYRSFGELRGAGFTDRTVWLTYYRVAPVLAIVLIGLIAYFLYKRKGRYAITAALVYPAVWLLACAAAFVVQTVVVSPNEVIREKESIANNIEYTRAAYGLDGIAEPEFDVKNDLTAADLRENESVTGNVRIVDLNANLTVLNQIQGIRNYYKFNETDIVPYDINGKKTAVAVTAREITKENLSDSADTYINRKLRYTHGFGIAMNTINSVTEQGQPELLIKDIPPKSADGIQTIKQPRIYYGELTDDYVIVGNKKYKELDYSEGQEDIEFSYDGSGGLRLGFFNRVMFAARYGDIRLLISDLVSSDSRILINRNITERLKVAAPFLSYDADPYIVIDSDGTLKWVVDAYTVSNAYPYSQSYGGFNYIRNSIKAVVDAYNGDVTFYVIDKNDPIAMSYAKIYPGMFITDEMPEGISRYTKYPEYLFGVRAAVYGKYHVSNPTSFYNKNDMWVVAKERYGTSTEEMDIAAYYNMMKLDDGRDEELLLSIPYTLANKDNMVAWLAARNDREGYGKLRVYKFPKDINVYGPMQIENRINAHMEISKELNLWSQGGSKVIRGNMIVVPINNSIIYVEPIYITSTNQTTLPELKQVIAAYDEKIVMKDTLSEALYALFDEKAPERKDEGVLFGEADYREAAKRVIDEFRRMKESASGGDWNAFGGSMQQLEESIDELEKNIGETGGAENTDGLGDENIGSGTDNAEGMNGADGAAPMRKNKADK